jgi:hypothetical protein
MEGWTSLIAMTYWVAADWDEHRGRRADEAEGLTYSFGNSPNAKEQRREVFPQAPGEQEFIELGGLTNGEIRRETYHRRL